MRTASSKFSVAYSTKHAQFCDQWSFRWPILWICISDLQTGVSFWYPALRFKGFHHKLTQDCKLKTVPTRTIT
eukprot:4408564-Amphidinium_carterae.1